ncbi:MAG: transposase [Coleofasciculaceae cyanobacterium]
MKKYNSQIHHRRSIRLQGYDYGQSGAYFITLCTYKKECWFGEICDSQMRLNQLGKIVAQEWLRTPQIRPEITLDEWIVMPNHLHGIIIVNNNTVGAHRRAPSSSQPKPHTPSPQFRRYSNSLPSIIAGFKSATTKRINKQRETQKTPLWQRNYYESVLRDTKHFEHARSYIYTNPVRWKDDPEFSQSALINDYGLPF